MNILYIADPGSIHDVRWINSLGESREIKTFVITRTAHLKSLKQGNNRLDPGVSLLGSVEDPSVIRPWRNWQQLFKIAKIIRRYDIDILHILYAEPNGLWANWKWFFQVPVIITTRGSDILRTIPEFSWRRSVLGELIARRYQRALNNADAICCTSAGQLKKLKAMEITSAATLVRTGVDFRFLPETEEKAAAKYGISQPFVFMPRNMKAVYNHEFTIDAIGLLPKYIKEKYSFIFVNSDSPDQSYFNAIFKKAKNCDADIRFLPSLMHAEFLGISKAASLVVMSPTSDGSPVTAMEAMALKVPVILPPLDYDMDVFGSAWFFGEWRAESLKEAIETVLLLDSTTVMVRLQESFQKIHQHGDTEKEMLKVRDLYRRLADV